MSIQNISESLLTKVLTDSTSVMYNRQATYYFLLRLNNWTRGDLHKAIKEKSESLKLPYNKGVTQKESAVALYCIEHKANLFKDFEISRTGYKGLIKNIAQVMNSNKLSYTYLKQYIVKSPMDSSDKNKAESTDSSVDINAVIAFINKASKADILKIQAALMNKSKASKASKASKNAA